MDEAELNKRLIELIQQEEEIAEHQKRALDIALPLLLQHISANNEEISLIKNEINKVTNINQL